MNIVIQELRRDHHNFHRVLKFLRQLVNLSATGMWPDVGGGERVLQNAFDYLQIYVANVHHIKEDLVFDAFATYCDFASVNLDRMRDEHATLSNQIGEIRDMAMSSVSPGCKDEKQGILLKEKMDQYFDTRVKHMQFEELSIYPPVETTLTINDWKDIIRQFPKTDDPVFGSSPSPKFKPLADGVVVMEKAMLAPGREVE